MATKADVGKEADVKAAVDKAVKEFGRLDVMVNKSASHRDVDSIHVYLMCFLLCSSTMPALCIPMTTMRSTPRSVSGI